MPLYTKMLIEDLPFDDKGLYHTETDSTLQRLDKQNFLCPWGLCCVAFQAGAFCHCPVVQTLKNT